MSYTRNARCVPNRRNRRTIFENKASTPMCPSQPDSGIVEHAEATGLVIHRKLRATSLTLDDCSYFDLELLSFWLGAPRSACWVRQRRPVAREQPLGTISNIPICRGGICNTLFVGNVFIKLQSLDHSDDVGAA